MGFGRGVGLSRERSAQSLSLHGSRAFSVWGSLGFRAYRA